VFLSLKYTAEKELDGGAMKTTNSRKIYRPYNHPTSHRQVRGLLFHIQKRAKQIEKIVTMIACYFSFLTKTRRLEQLVTSKSIEKSKETESCFSGIFSIPK
jgi:hypothetical protein